MTVLKGIARLVGRAVRLFAPGSPEARPLTEDDVRSDRYLRRHLAAH
jgi:hypothetical protein